MGRATGHPRGVSAQVNHKRVPSPTLVYGFQNARRIDVKYSGSPSR
jgi:hypothetical protein